MREPGMSEARAAADQADGNGQQGDDAEIVSRFLLAVGGGLAGADLEPAVLAHAAAQVLRVDGAGLSTMVSVLRHPLAATDDECRQAEELQTTLGDGPCLHAAQAREAVVSDLPDLEARWPQYAHELTRKTRYRAVASVPLRGTGSGAFAALDLYSASPTLSDKLNPEHVAAVGRIAGALLTTCMEQIEDGGNSFDAGPEWYRSVSGRRQDVWVAVGMVMARQRERTGNALSLLRAHAYSHSRSLDDVAADLVNGQLLLSCILD